MMRDLYFGVQLPFESARDRSHSEDILTRILGIVSRMNLQYLERHPRTKLLYDSGVTYSPPDQVRAPRPRPQQLRELFSLLKRMDLDAETALMVYRIVRGAEVFLDIPSLYRRGHGDCNEIVPVRIAECWRAGLRPSPYITKQRNSRGGWTYHVVLLHEDGSSEDPSLILGMGGPDHQAERAREISKNLERHQTYCQAADLMADGGEAPRLQLARSVDLMGFIPTRGVEAFATPVRRDPAARSHASEALSHEET